MHQSIMTKKLIPLAAFLVLGLTGCATSNRSAGMREFGYTFDLTAPPYPTHELGSGPKPLYYPDAPAPEKTAANNK